MFRKIMWQPTIINALIAAAIFCIPAGIYIYKADYTASWLLYLGSALFFFTIAFHTYLDSKKRGGDESTVALVFASHITTLAGVLISTIACFLMLTFLIPGFMEHHTADKILENAPPNTIKGNTNGLSMYVFIAATIINFTGGSFASITIPFYAKRNQTKDNRQPVPFQQ